jgi:hypothetical protein
VLAVVSSVSECAVACVLLVRLCCANAAVLAWLVGEADVVDLVAVSSGVAGSADSRRSSACAFNVGRSFIVITTAELMSAGLNVGSIAHISDHVDTLASDFEPSETSLEALRHSNASVENDSLVITTDVEVCLQIQDLSATAGLDFVDLRLGIDL